MKKVTRDRKKKAQIEQKENDFFKKDKENKGKS